MGKEIVIKNREKSSDSGYFIINNIVFKIIHQNIVNFFAVDKFSELTVSLII